MNVISIISQSLHHAVRSFSSGEKSMLIDIYNGTYLFPQALGHGLLPNVVDSFELYPGMYEEKWGVDREAMIAKVNSMDALTAALAEMWAVGYWAVYKDIPLEQYIDDSHYLGGLEEGVTALIRKMQDAAEDTAPTVLKESAEALERML